VSDNPTADQDSDRYKQRVAILKSKTKAFRWKPGTSGNPGGNSRAYYETRKIALAAGPEMMRELIKLARTAEDERTRAFCQVAALDRGGIKPIEPGELFDQLKAHEKKEGSGFNPANFSASELQIISQALTLIIQRRDEMAVAAMIEGDVSESDA
jgi:hypothetical protein